MKNKVITPLTFAMCVITPSMSQARSFMPRLEQLRNKIETIAQTTPQANIQKLLESARIEHDAHGTIHKIIDLNQTSTDVDLLEKEINELYWSKRTDLVTQAQAQKITSKEEHHALLFKELTQKYPNNNRAVLPFASDLANEETKLNDLTTRILKAIGDEKKSPSAAKLNELFQTVIKLKQNLQIITTFVNDTLLSS